MDKTTLVQALRNIPYIVGSTNMPDALCNLITLYSDNSFGAHLETGVFRIAILMTDGHSNRNANPFNFMSVAEAANAVHAVRPPITVFAFGVGDQ